MNQVWIVAGLIIVTGAAAARYAEQALNAPSNQETLAKLETPPAEPPRRGGRSVVVSPDKRGHFRVDGRVDGKHMAFMVDTGASVIALTAYDASRLGIRPVARDFTVDVTTANGTVRAAQVRLGQVEIEDVVVRDVVALVVPDNALSENLLGLSFLSRLHRFEYSRGRLMLEQ